MLRRSDLDAAYRIFPRALTGADLRLPHVSNMAKQIMQHRYGFTSFIDLLDELESSGLTDATVYM